MNQPKRQTIEALRAGLSPEQRELLRQRFAAANQAADLADVPRAGVAAPAAPVRPDSTRSAAPEADAITRAGRARAAEGVPPPGAVTSELASLEAEDARGVELACRALASVGFRAGDRLEAGALPRRLSSRPLYDKLLARWVVELQAKGVISGEANELTLTPRFDDVLRASPAETPPYWPPTHGDVVAVLRGEKHALEFMDRAGGVFENVKAFHRATPRSRYLNSIVASLLGAYAEGHSGMIRVLEVGAGVGGTTRSALDALPEERSSYVFTDLSNAFFDFARHDLGDLRNVTYRTYDMNDPPPAHGFEDDSFDIVLGSNALHCARDAGATSKNLVRLLAPGGWLVVRELTRPRAAHMILPGLLPGFSDFDDERLARHTPLLSRDAWRGVFASAGLEAVTVLPDGEPGDAFGEHVLLGRKPTTDAR